MAHFTGARKAILIATSIHMSTPNPFEPRGGGGKGNGGLIAAACEAGRIIAAMDRNPEPLRSWLWVAYSAFHNQEQLQRVQCTLWDRIVQTCEPPAKIRPQLRALIILLMHDNIQRWTSGTARFTNAQMGRAIGVQVDAKGHFWRPWEKYEKAVYDILDEWDRHALGPVAAEVDRMREEYEREALRA